MTEYFLQEQTLLQIYHTMVKIRLFEEEIAHRWPEQEMRSPPHFCTGKEAIAASVCAALDPQDQVIGYYRGHGYYLAKDGDPKALMAEMYCKRTGCNEGKGGSMLLSYPKTGYIGSSAIVAGGIPIATGLAFANKIRQTGQVVTCFFGDAATEEGVFHESLNFAALQKLPIVFICENDSYAVTTHISKRRAAPDKINQLADPYNIPSQKIDGNDPLAIYPAAKTAIERAREDLGPTLIEALTYRWNEHVGEKRDDNTGIRTKEELEYWINRDPIVYLEKKLLKTQTLTKEIIREIYLGISDTIKEAFEFAASSPLPTKEDLLTNVYP